MRIALVGEALIDFTSTGPLAFQGHAGGSTLNTAIACVKLGQETGLITQLSTDLFGEQLLGVIQRSGLDTRLLTRDEASTTLAFVERTASTNRYAFYLRGSSTARWSPAELPALPDSCRYLQFGSISVLLEPAASRITELVQAQSGKRIVVFDPNVRPTVIGDMDAYRRRVAAWLRSTDLLKVSDEDVAALSPGKDLVKAAADYLAEGPHAVIITRGEQGATLYRKDRPAIEVASPVVTVADTIGAGDTFTAGVMVRLLEHGVDHPRHLADLEDMTWHDVLAFAATAAALNCTREGADPPSRAEVVALSRVGRYVLD